MKDREIHRLLTLNELCSLLLLKKSWVYERTRTREIPCLKLGRHLRFDPDEIQEWLEQRKRRVFGDAGAENAHCR